jgi:hypothetical protein
MYRLCWTQHSSDCVIEASNEVNISKKPPLFSTMFPTYNYSWKWPFLLQFIFKNCNLFFSIANHKCQKVQVENEIVVESDDRVSTPF